MLLNPLENTDHDFPIVLTWKPLAKKQGYIKITNDSGPIDFINLLIKPYLLFFLLLLLLY